MASLIGKPVGKVAQEITELEQGRIFQSPLNKVWRALILINRATSPMAKAEPDKLGKEYDAQNAHVARKGSYSLAQTQSEWYQNIIAAEKAGISPYKVLKAKSVNYTLAHKFTSELIKNDIVIANLNVSPAISLVIQNRPDRLKVEPAATWAAVKSMGRNNPFYFYTGGEDTITFDISWYSVDEAHRDDVVNKCRLLESWARADGYSASPPTLRIQWGDSGLFEDDLFILAAAPYELTHFQNASRKMRGRYYNVSRPYNLKLLPNCATQTLTFKRVTKNNRTWEEIIPASKLQYTPGVIIDGGEVDSLENSDTERIGTQN